MFQFTVDWLIERLIVDCGSWIACKIKDSCKRSTLVCYISYISVSISKIAPKHCVNRVLERHLLESYEIDFWSPQVPDNQITGIGQKILYSCVMKNTRFVFFLLWNVYGFLIRWYRQIYILTPFFRVGPWHWIPLFYI